MRIELLDLVAYGHFRAYSLDFSAPALHVVFGRNEAGKSTTLRAITGLLFGIERNTRDAHVHKPADLRIGGVLVGENGERIRVVRRKGNANTLLDERGQPLDEAVLARMLRGISEETFRHAYGLDHDTLQRGAQALLDGKGDLGESLFDASVGGGGEVQRLLAELVAEADTTYRPRATSLPLNDALRAFADAQKVVKERQSLPEAYVAQERALEAAQAERAARGERRAALVASRDELDRARRRVPLERRRRVLLEERAGLAALPSHELGAAAARVDGLHAKLGAYQRAVVEGRELAFEAEALRGRVAEAARRAGVAAPQGTDAALESVPRVAARSESRIRQLLNERTALSERIDAARTELARAEREIKRVSSQSVAAPRDVSDVAVALERARALGDVETRVANEGARLERRRAELATRAKVVAAAVGLDVPLDALVALSLPEAESVENLAGRAAAVDRARARAEERIAELDAETAAIERQIAENDGEFAPPGAADLRRARSERDAAWDALRDAGATAGGSEGRAYEKLRRDADEVADRMIREADRVTLLARLRSSRDTHLHQRRELEAERRARVDERRGLDEELVALFAPSGVRPTSLDAVRAFLDRRGQLVDSFARLREAELDLADQADVCASARSELARRLGSETSRLADLVHEAGRLLERVERETREADEAAKTLAKLTTSVDERRAAIAHDEAHLAEVKAKLAELVAPLGIAEDAGVDEVASALEALREFFGLETKRAEVEVRAKAAAEEAQAFEAAVAAAVAALAPELGTCSPVEGVTALVSRMKKAQAIDDELHGVEERLAEVSNEAVAPEVLEAVALDGAARALEAIELELADVDHDLSRLNQNIGAIRAGLDRMRADSNAAEAAEVAQAALARVRAGVDRYCRAKLAATLLAREIDRFREENQGPVLAQASGLFARLTRGAYTGVRAGFDERDKPCLRCVRSGDVEVDVAGLSLGTRDQLYLALRLASLLRRADVMDPAPLVLDDVLVQLDDERAAAAIAVLAEVARRMQVLFFTHHARLVEIAQRTVPTNDLVVHELAAGGRDSDARPEGSPTA